MDSGNKLTLETIRPLKVLGNGALGTVFLANHPSISSPFALKVVDKSNSAAQRRAQWELSVLSNLPPNHPFLPTLLGSFQAHDLMGWAVPFCSGGDLNALRYNQPDHVFSPSAIRFYLAEIICALQHLHSVGIAYRDLKPENVLLQDSGHVTLTDFDLSCFLKQSDMEAFNPSNKLIKPRNNKNKNKNKVARLLSFSFGPAQVSPEVRRRSSFSCGKRSHSFVGTEEYVSPEVIRGEGHAFGVDWWALGVLAYEMLYGKTPFRGKNKKETYRNVVFKHPEFMGQRTALIDLIQRLLEKDPTKRIGNFRGAEEIKEHEFFNGLRWELLTEVVRPPLVPSSIEVTEKLMVFDVREYFQKLKVKSSFDSSPVNSFSSSTEL